MNRAALDSRDLEAAAEVGQVDGGQFLALVGEHLDARVDVLVVEGIVVDLLVIQIHRRRSGRLGIGGHLQLFRSRLGELSLQHERQGRG